MANFPAPVAELKSGPVWKRAEIIEWAKSTGVQVATAESSKAQSTPRRKTSVVVAVVNMKGGVGKSTVTANLGWHSAYKKNHKVLLVDLDPQFNLSQYALGRERYQEFLRRKRPSVYEIFEQTSSSPGMREAHADLSQAIIQVKAWSDGSRLDLVPSRLDLAWTLKSSSYSKIEHLSSFLEPLRRKYDLVLIDCPPTQSMLTDAAYRASGYVLIPVRPEFLSTIGLPLLVKSLEDFQLEHRNKEIEIAGILFNAVTISKNEHQKSRNDVMTLAKKNGWYVFKNEISYSDSYPKGSREGKPIFLTGYARWDKVNEFEALANEFLQRIGL
ncbi:MAG TPA: ParA family protein [Terriglobales bacterium]|nr:ParA family protein [Terriglobales bacterium]